MFAKIINELTNPDSDLRSGRAFWLKRKQQKLVQIATPLDPNTQTMETMKDDRVASVKILTGTTGSAKCDEKVKKTCEEEPYDVSDIV